MRSILLILLILASAGCFTTAGQRQRTTRTGRLQPAVQSAISTHIDSVIDTAVSDTIKTDLNRYVHLAGYDKPLTASRETVHVQNLTDSLVVTAIECEITYLDSNRRQLHRRTVTLRDNIAPGDTELVSFPTWDIQRSFYYLLSVKPRRQATPYDIDLNILSITCHKIQ